MSGAAYSCEGCGRPACGATSAHFALVVRMCCVCSDEFHAAEALAHFRSGATTADQQALIRHWLHYRPRVRTTHVGDAKACSLLLDAVCVVVAQVTGALQ